MLNTNVEMSNKNFHVVSAYHYPCLCTFLLIVEKIENSTGLSLIDGK